MGNMPKMHQAVMDSIFEVFEKMFYIFLEAAEPQDGGYAYQTAILFSGPLKGGMAIHFSRSLAEAMVQNMLNVDRNEIDDSLLEDCLKESLNMICGNFLSKFDASNVLNLSIPLFTVNEQSHVHADAVSDEQNVRLDFAGGDGRVALILTVPAER